jgi:hypothetical protein
MATLKKLVSSKIAQSGLITVAIIFALIAVVNPVNASLDLNNPNQVGHTQQVGYGGDGADTNPPNISGINTSNTTANSTIVSWTTNELSTSQVEYWSSPSQFSPLDKRLVINHIVHLWGLNPATTYYYKTMSRDGSGNLTISDVHTLTTLKTPATSATRATFATSTLSITPAEVTPEEKVTISAVIANTGDVKGTYVATLKIDGVVEATKELTIDAASSGTVVFSTSRDVPGTYDVNVGALSGSFIVKEVVPLPQPPVTPTPPASEEVAPPEGVNWWIIGPIIAVVVIGLLVYFLWRRRILGRPFS